MILIDSNIPMYLVGASHAHKSDAQRLIEKFINEQERLVTDSEVLREILHRFVAINRRNAIQPTFDSLLAVTDEVLPVDRKIVERAKQIVLGYNGLSARDAVHIAVMEAHGIDRIMSFDTGFDEFPGISRIF